MSIRFLLLFCILILGITLPTATKEKYTSPNFAGHLVGNG